MADVPRVAGYGYTYDFSIKKDLVSSYKHKLRPGHTNLIFEIKTSSILKTINGQDEMIDSEVINTVLEDDGSELLWIGLNCVLTKRFEDYWMDFDEIRRFDIEAIDYARRAADAADPSPDHRVVPVFVDFKVRTIQLDGEPVGAAMERALRAGHLVPFFDNPFRDNVSEFLEFHLKHRVGDNDGGLAMMRICGICSRGPFIGCLISLLHTCRHAFHSHCYAQWLLKGNKLCPSCTEPAYDFAWHDNDDDVLKGNKLYPSCKVHLD